MASACPWFYLLAEVSELGITLAQQMKNVFYFFLITWEWHHAENLKRNYRGSTWSWKIRICGFNVSIYVSLWGCVILKSCLSSVLAMATYLAATLPSCFPVSAEVCRWILLQYTSLESKDLLCNQSHASVTPCNLAVPIGPFWGFSPRIWFAVLPASLLAPEGSWALSSGCLKSLHLQQLRILGNFAYTEVNVFLFLLIWSCSF